MGYHCSHIGGYSNVVAIPRGTISRVLITGATVVGDGAQDTRNQPPVPGEMVIYPGNQLVRDFG